MTNPNCTCAALSGQCQSCHEIDLYHAGMRAGEIKSKKEFSQRYEALLKELDSMKEKVRDMEGFVRFRKTL